MVIYCLDKNLNKQDVAIDLFSSFIWNPRYQEPGIFQLNCDVAYFDMLNKSEDVFLLNTEDLDHVGVVENIDLKSSENGIELVVKGRMAESIMERRVALGEYSFVDENVVTIFDSVITPNMTNSTDLTRNIPLFEVGDSPEITDISTSEIHNENILTMVQRLCRINDVGFKVAYTEDLGVPKLKLIVYKGKDRTVGQSLNSVAVISRGQDTSLSSGYLKDSSKMVTFVYVKGEEDISTTVAIGSPDGLYRREIYLDLSAIVKKTINNPDASVTVLSNEDYIKALQSTAKDSLARMSESFDSEFNQFGELEYGIDFYIGDIVTCIEDASDFSADKTVYGVQIVYDDDGKSISLELGEYLAGNSMSVIPMQTSPGGGGSPSPSSGDMLKSVYDTDEDGKVNVAETADKLTTARKINGVDFDGSTDITIADSTKEPALGASTSGNYLRGDRTWSSFASGVRGTVLTGLVTTTNAVITTADSILTAFGKIQKQITDNLGTLTNHIGDVVAHITATERTNWGTAYTHSQSAHAPSNATINATDAQLRDRSTHTGTQVASTITQDANNRFVTDVEKTSWNNKLNSNLKGAANGLAELDSSGKVPSAQLPSFVDDVIEGTLATFPATGETGKIYVDTATNMTYRWSGTLYAEISSSIALGETPTTAYRGDRGKTAYDHSQAAHAPAGATVNSTDAQLRDRSTHTGAQAATTITEDATHRFATDAEKIAWNAKEPAIASGSDDNYYFSGVKTWVSVLAKVRGTALTGLVTTTNAVITATDTVLSAFGKIQKQITDHLADGVSHITGAERTSWNGKQSALVSGTNIKTVNGNSLLGAGDIALSSSVAWGNVTGTITSQTDLANALNGKSNVSSVVNATLLAASWTGASAPYTYTLAVAGVTATSIQEIMETTTNTAAEIAALQSANIRDGGQSAGSITLKAFGSKPTIDLPIRIIKRGDM